jgi:hypothetical protein
MQQIETRNFIPFVADGQGGFLNLDAVRLVDQIRPGHIRLIFSETHLVEINGEGAAGILARISDRAVDGRSRSGIIAAAALRAQPRWK